jgi:hypothetical protein
MLKRVIHQQLRNDTGYPSIQGIEGRLEACSERFGWPPHRTP